MQKGVVHSGENGYPAVGQLLGHCSENTHTCAPCLLAQEQMHLINMVSSAQGKGLSVQKWCYFETSELKSKCSWKHCYIAVGHTLDAPARLLETELG